MYTLNVEFFREAAEQGRVKRVVRGPFELFNYTIGTTVERDWDNVTLESRGVVFQDGQIVCRPMRKFFNSHEPGVVTGNPEVVHVKLDGTLINVWFDLAGDLQVSTRGSLNNEYIDAAKDLIAERGIAERIKSMMSETTARHNTFSFEYTYPQDRFPQPSVVPHQNERLTLLNVRARASGVEIAASNVAEFNRILYPAPEEQDYYYDLHVNTTSADLQKKMEELAQHIPYTDEGWVLSYYDSGINKRMKVKGAEYVAIHRVVHGMTPRSIADAWYAMVADTLIGMLPQAHADRLRNLFEPYDRELATAVTAVRKWIDGFVTVNGDEFERREFVVEAQRDIPDYWQLAINEHYNNGADYRMWVVRKLTSGKAPRVWKMPVTDDVKE